MSNNKNEKDTNQEVNQELDKFLGNSTQEDCTGDECIIKTDKSIVERMNKKIITDDGRQLLM